MVNIVIGNITSKIVGHLPDNVQDEIYKVLAYKCPGAKYIQRVKNHQWDGVYRLYYKNKAQSFYSGLASLVVDILKKHKVEFAINDYRIVPDQNLPYLTFTPPNGYQERDYQDFTIDRAYKKTRGILQMATGSGKTMTISRLIAKIKTSPFMFYVLTRDLLDQAYELLSETLNEPIGRIGAGHFDIKNINVCTIQTVIRAINNNNANFKISDYLFDEEDSQYWKEEQLEDIEKVKAVQKLLVQTKGIYVDECITGDSNIVTEFGDTKIQDVERLNCKEVRTFDEKDGVTYRKITNFWKKGKKQILKITTQDKKILKCTYEHLIYTKRGWICAEKLLISDQVCREYPHTDKEYFGSYVLLTKWVGIKKIEQAKEQEVYDIEVEGTHCFFANGILVHNCHHAAAKTIIDVINASPNAFWKYGGSATPYREDNAEIVIQGLFGKKIVDINASYLIDRGYLLQPYIFFVPVDDNCILHSWKSVYSTCVAKNEAFNKKVAEIANHFVKRGLTTLVLVQQYAQGNEIKKTFDTKFITGKTPPEERKNGIQEIRDGVSKSLIASTILDEGVDIKSLNMLLLAGGGASTTRLYQRIGRTLRIDNKAKVKMDKSIVIYFEHNARYLKDHAKRARKIIKMEPSFKVINSNGLDYVCNEIDSVLGISDSDNIFDRN